jgi:hypothetical protein
VPANDVPQCRALRNLWENMVLQGIYRLETNRTSPPRHEMPTTLAMRRPAMRAPVAAWCRQLMASARLPLEPIESGISFAERAANRVVIRADGRRRTHGRPGRHREAPWAGFGGAGRLLLEAFRGRPLRLACNRLHSLHEVAFHTRPKTPAARSTRISLFRSSSRGTSSGQRARVNAGSVPAR